MINIKLLNQLSFLKIKLVYQIVSWNLLPIEIFIEKSGSFCYYFSVCSW